MCVVRMMKRTLPQILRISDIHFHNVSVCLSTACSCFITNVKDLSKYSGQPFPKTHICKVHVIFLTFWQGLIAVTFLSTLAGSVSEVMYTSSSRS
jgi:hypothetical protein